MTSELISYLIELGLEQETRLCNAIIEYMEVEEC